MIDTSHRLRRGGLALAIAAGVALGLIVERATALTDSVMPEPNSTGSNAAHRPVASHGEDSGFFNVAIEPLAVVQGDKGARIDFDVSVQTNFEGTSAFAVEYLIVDVHGAIVGEVKAPSPLVALSKGEVGLTLSTPEGLGDGAYAMRVLIVGADTKNDATFETGAYFSVERGDMTLMDMNEWRALPAVSEGHQL